MTLSIYKDRNKDFPIANYFEIANFSAYKCFIRDYSRSHSYLKISVIKDKLYTAEDIPFRLDFSAVIYFEGPLQWHGANFCVAPPSECLALLRDFKEYASLNDEQLLRTYILFTVDTSNFQVKILAVKDISSDSS